MNDLNPGQTEGQKRSILKHGYNKEEVAAIEKVLDMGLTLENPETEKTIKRGYSEYEVGCSGWGFYTKMYATIGRALNEFTKTETL